MTTRRTARRICAVLIGCALSVVVPATARADTPRPVSVLSAPVQFAEVAGATLGYREAGKGLPLVMIAGSSNTMAEWDPHLLDELASTRRIIVFDNRGAGTSTGDVTALTIELMARDTAQLIAQVAGGRADVLGWSMGGFVAQELAIRHPESVRRLVLASTDCGGPDTAGPTPRALRVLTDPDATTAQRMSILFPRDRQGAASAWTAAVGAAYAAGGYQPENAFDVSPATARAQVKASGPLWLTKGRGTCDRIHRITAQTLIAAGRKDVVVPIVNLKPLSSGIPNSTAVTYRNAGHAFLFQPGLGFAQKVGAFLDRRP
jgi:pimeloyl-ACP methyl ester carboxylesterase